MENYYTDESGQLQESNFYDILYDLHRKKSWKAFQTAFLNYYFAN